MNKLSEVLRTIQLHYPEDPLVSYGLIKDAIDQCIADQKNAEVIIDAANTFKKSQLTIFSDHPEISEKREEGTL